MIFQILNLPFIKSEGKLYIFLNGKDVLIKRKLYLGRSRLIEPDVIYFVGNVQIGPKQTIQL